MFEVRSQCIHEPQSPGCYYVETKRTERKDAEQDADLLKLFGKKAWITEVDE
jgi:hypothetical protein